MSRFLPSVPRSLACGQVGVVYGDAVEEAQTAAAFCQIMVLPAVWAAQIRGPTVLPYGHAWLVRDYDAWYDTVRTTCLLPVSVDPIAYPNTIVADPLSAWPSVWDQTGCHFADCLFASPAEIGADPESMWLTTWPNDMLDWWRRVTSRPKVFNGLMDPYGLEAWTLADGAMLEQFAQGADSDADTAMLDRVLTAQEEDPTKTVLLVSSNIRDRDEHEWTRGCALLVANRHTFYSWNDSRLYRVAPANDTAVFTELGPPDQSFTEIAQAQISPGVYRRYFRHGIVTVDMPDRRVTIEDR